MDDSLKNLIAQSTKKIEAERLLKQDNKRIKAAMEEANAIRAEMWRKENEREYLSDLLKRIVVKHSMDYELLVGTGMENPPEDDGYLAVVGMAIDHVIEYNAKWYNGASIYCIKNIALFGFKNDGISTKQRVLDMIDLSLLAVAPLMLPLFSVMSFKFGDEYRNTFETVTEIQTEISKRLCSIYNIKL